MRSGGLDFKNLFNQCKSFLWKSIKILHSGAIWRSRFQKFKFIQANENFILVHPTGLGLTFLFRAHLGNRKELDVKTDLSGATSEGSLLILLRSIYFSLIYCLVCVVRLYPGDFAQSMVLQNKAVRT